MAPIGSTSSNIRRAIERFVSASCCTAGALSWLLTLTWTTTHRETHRTSPARRRRTPTSVRPPRLHPALAGVDPFQDRAGQRLGGLLRDPVRDAGQFDEAV